jgi:type IV pilus assembly protein PilQ
MHHKSIYIVLLLLVFGCLEVSAQTGDPFELRMQEIERQLSMLAATDASGLVENANFSVVNASVQDLLRGVAETHNLNISVDPAIQSRITNNFTEVKVQDLLLFVCREYKLNIRFLNTILSFHPFEVPKEVVQYVPQKLRISYDPASDKISMDLNRDSLSLFVRQLTEKSRKNILLAPGVDDRRISGYFTDVPFEQGLSKLAYANGLVLEVTEGGFYVLQKPETSVQPPAAGMRTGAAVPQRQLRNQSPLQRTAVEGLFLNPVYRGADTLLTLEAVNVPVKDVIKEAALALNKNYIFFSEPAGVAITSVKAVTFDELLNYLLQGSAHGHVKQQGVYLLGERSQEGFRATRLYKFQFRTLDEVVKSIPPEIAKGVQINPFAELNAIILSGSAARITELESFLKEIDQPVPNIVIEVIVIDVRKGNSLQTGISAFLSDSVPPTSGQVFPGLDVTLSPRSVNKVLDRLEDAGIVNLGRVRPNFYVKLQALEQNNNIKVRSTPKLSTLNGHEAVMSIGQSVYYKEEAQNVTGGVTPIVTTTQRFQKVDANLQIKISPVVSGDEHVTLKIEAEFSDFTAPTEKGLPPGNASRKFISQIRVKNEEMIVLGGLEEARKERQHSGLPLISRIPVLKWFFSSKSDVNRDDKLMIFIRPSVVY